MMQMVKTSQRKWQQQKKKKIILKELSEIFQDIEGSKDKILEADPNLVGSGTISQGLGRMLPPPSKSYDNKKTTTAVHTTHDKVFIKYKIL